MVQNPTWVLGYPGSSMKQWNYRRVSTKSDWPTSISTPWVATTTGLWGCNPWDVCLTCHAIPVHSLSHFNTGLAFFAHVVWLFLSSSMRGVNSKSFTSGDMSLRKCQTEGPNSNPYLFNINPKVKLAFWRFQEIFISKFQFQTCFFTLHAQPFSIPTSALPSPVSPRSTEDLAYRGLSTAGPPKGHQGNARAHPWSQFGLLTWSSSESHGLEQPSAHHQIENCPGRTRKCWYPLECTPWKSDRCYHYSTHHPKGPWDETAHNLNRTDCGNEFSYISQILYIYVHIYIYIHKLT